MIWLGCGGGGWFECLVAIISKAFGPVVEGLIKVIFQPILDALFDAVGKLMTTIATFWVFVPTQSVGNTTTGQPSSGTVGWIWGHTSWIAVFAATISVIIAGAHMAWSQRGEAARDLLRSLLTLAVASTLAISVTQILIEVGDQFSKCIVLTALDNSGAGWTCKMQDATATNFGAAMLGVMGFVSGGGFSGLGIGLLITIGVITVLASVIQIVMMVVRSAMLILLVGVLPIAAAATNTEMGRGWFKRIISWLVAFILYKPVAALVYATAIRLTQGSGPLAYTHEGNPKVGTEASVGTDIMNMVTGLTMLMLALFALPALMKFIAPMVAATAGGAGAGAIAGKLVGMGPGIEKLADQASESAKSQSEGPTGARNVGKPSSGSSPQPSGPQGAPPSPQPTGQSGGAPPPAAPSSAAPSSAATGTASTSSAAAGSAAGGGAAAGGAAAGGGAAAAGAAGGPVGVAVVAGAMAVKKGAEMAGDAAKAGVNETIDNDAMDGPSGSG
jgi:hypothetical protein